MLEAEAKWVRGKAEEIGFVLIIDGIPGIQRQAEISRAEAGEHRPRVCCGAGVFAVRSRGRWRSGPAIQMAGVAVRLATEEVVTGQLVGRQHVSSRGSTGLDSQVGIEFRRKTAAIGVP